jgi:hypothetical protein
VPESWWTAGRWGSSPGEPDVDQGLFQEQGRRGLRSPQAGKAPRVVLAFDSTSHVSQG